MLFVSKPEILARVNHWPDEIKMLEHVVFIEGRGEGPMSALEHIGRNNPVPAVYPHADDIFETGTDSCKNYLVLRLLTESRLFFRILLVSGVCGSRFKKLNDNVQCRVINTLGVCFDTRTLGICFDTRTLGICFDTRTLGMGFDTRTLGMGFDTRSLILNARLN